MKKLLIGSFLLLLLLIGCGKKVEPNTTVQLEEASIELAKISAVTTNGDINQDGVFNILDIVYLIKVYKQQQLNDVNKDGKLDIEDINLLVTMYKER